MPEDIYNGGNCEHGVITLEPQSYGLLVNQTLELNKYLVSISKIAIKNVKDNQVLLNITKL